MGTAVRGGEDGTAVTHRPAVRGVREGDRGEVVILWRRVLADPAAAADGDVGASGSDGKQSKHGNQTEQQGAFHDGSPPGR